MRVEHLAFPTNKFPCFGFAVCSDNGKLYLPEYSEYDTVFHFVETIFETMYLYKYNEKYEINIGDNRTYVYMINGSEFIVGTINKIRPRLIQALSKIHNAPFSKLELAGFLKIDKHILKVIHNECYIFLKKIDEKQAQQWAIENSYDLLFEESIQAIEQFKDYLHQQIGEIIGFVYGSFKINTWPTVNVTVSRGVPGERKNTDVILKCDGQDSSQNDIVIINKNKDFFEFELFKQTKILINLLEEINNEYKYELYLWSITDGVIDSYSVEKMQQGEIVIFTDTLHAGKYIATVINRPIPPIFTIKKNRHFVILNSARNVRKYNSYVTIKNINEILGIMR